MMSNLKERHITSIIKTDFTKLFEAAEIAKFTKKERTAYEESLKYYRDLKNVVDTSRQEGVMEGMEKGLEQGIEKGIDQRNIEITPMLISKGMNNQEIAEITGLRESDIQELRK